MQTVESLRVFFGGGGVKNYCKFLIKKKPAQTFLWANLVKNFILRNEFKISKVYIFCQLSCLRVQEEPIKAAALLYSLQFTRYWIHNKIFIMVKSSTLHLSSR